MPVQSTAPKGTIKLVKAKLGGSLSSPDTAILPGILQIPGNSAGIIQQTGNLVIAEETQNTDILSEETTESSKQPEISPDIPPVSEN